MAILSFIKAWGPYKPGDILSSHSVPTIKALTETYRVAIMLDRLPVVIEPKPEIVLESELQSKPEPEPILESEMLAEIATELISEGTWPTARDDEPAPTPVLRRRPRKPKPKPE